MSRVSGVRGVSDVRENVFAVVKSIPTFNPTGDKETVISISANGSNHKKGHGILWARAEQKTNLGLLQKDKSGGCSKKQKDFVLTGTLHVNQPGVCQSKTERAAANTSCHLLQLPGKKHPTVIDPL